MEAREDRQNSSAQSTPSSTPHSSPKQQRRYSDPSRLCLGRPTLNIWSSLHILAVFAQELVQQYELRRQRELLQQQRGLGRRGRGGRGRGGAVERVWAADAHPQVEL